MNEQYFYCYSPRLKGRLLNEGERFICVGLNEKTGKKFWLFKQTDKLTGVLSEWKREKS
ncbi:hypothetical protein [Thalassobacillus sp. CUG 92003]|uniref:hypothetical protein n=1 Tax=Thalassobacillus sp. CUG 92003 TaxID=2736641 RepID=UPI0015E788D7|nr:hypothetical protein [Thalassobacillus sp. CUG 92003]